MTFAQFRDRRRIFDIEAYSRQQFTSEVVPGLAPTQRAPQGGRSDSGGGRGFGGNDRGPRGDFGGRPAFVGKPAGGPKPFTQMEPHARSHFGIKNG